MNARAPSASWSATVITLFPEMFPGSLGQSLAGQALADGVWSLETVDIRQFARDKHRVVDDTPFGGGPGMVLRADVVDAAIAAADVGPKGRAQGNAKGKESAGRPFIYLTPRGKPLTQERVRELARGKGLVALCGRYEGIDERVVEAYGPEEVSVGDFVLSGGEPAVMAMIDACVRLLPGVMGSAASPEEESFERGLLEYPHYTKPRNWQGRDVPEVLLSGHHERVHAWRLEEAEKATRARRPDLWARYKAHKNDE